MLGLAPVSARKQVTIDGIPSGGCNTVESSPKINYSTMVCQNGVTENQCTEKPLNDSRMRSQPLLHGRFLVSICNRASILIESLPKPPIKLR